MAYLLSLGFNSNESESQELILECPSGSIHYFFIAATIILVAVLFETTLANRIIDGATEASSGTSVSEFTVHYATGGRKSTLEESFKIKIISFSFSFD